MKRKTARAATKRNRGAEGKGKSKYARKQGHQKISLGIKTHRIEWVGVDYKGNAKRTLKQLPHFVENNTRRPAP